MRATREAVVGPSQRSDSLGPYYLSCGICSKQQDIAEGRERPLGLRVWFAVCGAPASYAAPRAPGALVA
eukprot:4296069-Lingulodinium_polyedra.AAC.1